jgi:hypothetical protein
MLNFPLMGLADIPMLLDAAGNALAASNVGFHATGLAGLCASQ